MEHILNFENMKSRLIPLRSEDEMVAIVQSSSLRDRPPEKTSENRKFWLYENLKGENYLITISHEIDAQEYRFRRSDGHLMTPDEFEDFEEDDVFLNFTRDHDYAFIEAMASDDNDNVSSEDLKTAFLMYSEKMNCDMDRLVDLAREQSNLLYNRVQNFAD